MRLFLSVLLWLASLSVLESVQAADVWICTYPGFTADRRPVIVRFKEQDGFMVEEEFGTKYRILENNEYGVVATWSISLIEPGHATPSIGSMTFLIKKKTGDFLRSN